MKYCNYIKLDPRNSRSQWPRGLRPKSAAARLPRLWVRIPPDAWMFVCFECCELSGRGLCEELITRPEESYRLWCVVVCELGTSFMRRPWPTGGLSRQKKQTNKQKKAPASLSWNFRRRSFWQEISHLLHRSSFHFCVQRRPETWSCERD